jgi:hypothetical protein
MVPQPDQDLLDDVVGGMTVAKDANGQRMQRGGVAIEHLAQGSGVTAGQSGDQPGVIGALVSVPHGGTDVSERGDRQNPRQVTTRSSKVRGTQHHGHIRYPKLLGRSDDDEHLLVPSRVRAAVSEGVGAAACHSIAGGDLASDLTLPVWR